MPNGNRRPLEEGGFVDIGSAERFDESTYFDGKNHISSATDSEWNHEALYRTKKGNWVLEKCSQTQGTKAIWTEIDPLTACNWLIKNNHGDKVPDVYADDLEV